MFGSFLASLSILTSAFAKSTVTLFFTYSVLTGELMKQFYLHLYFST